MAKQQSKKEWYKQWWAIVLMILIGMMAIGSLIPDDWAPTEDVGKSSQTTQPANYKLIANAQAGSTTIYYASADPKYRNESSLPALAKEIYAGLGNDKDYTVKLYDSEMAANFVVSVPQSEWKREPGGRDDYSWVAQHQFAVLTNNAAAKTQETLYYPDGMNGRSINQ